MELQTQLETFRARGAEVVALAVAPMSSVQNTKRSLGIDFPMLADPAHDVTGGYGIYNILEDGYAAPTVLVIDTGGQILWSYVGQSPFDRPAAETILNNLP